MLMYGKLVSRDYVGCSVEGSAIHHGNRQMLGKAGETPPLPRNCERTCPSASHFIGSSNEAGFQSGVPGRGGDPGNHWRRVIQLVLEGG